MELRPCEANLMTAFDLKTALPNSEQRPCSDDIPVDNEDQNLLPNFLLFLLENHWKGRMDWFFGVDMAIYHTTGVSPKVPVVPDAFLSLGVERRKDGKSRKSYALWDEGEVAPSLALEMVSLTPGGEYDNKMEIYAHLGVLYYVVYNPEYWQRDRHQPFEIYKLINHSYQLQVGEPQWMPEIGLGIGRHRRVLGEIERELLYWYRADGSRYLADDEQKAKLMARLKEMGVDPETLI